MKKFKLNPDIIGWLGVFTTLLGTILPTIYVANVPMNYISGDGKFIAIAMCFVLFFIIRKRAITSLLPTTLACFLLGRYLFVTAPTRAVEIGLDKIAVYGPGLFLMIIGLCLCLAYGVVGKQKVIEKEKIPFNRRYYFLSLFFPIIGIYWFITYDKKDKIKSMNSFNGAVLGCSIFFAYILVHSLLG